MWWHARSSPEGIERPLFLFRKAGNGKYAVRPIEDSLSTNPAASLRFLNLTQDTTQLILALGENAEIKMPLQPLVPMSHEMRDEDSGNLRFQIAGEFDGAARILKDARIYPNLQSRYIYFIYKPDVNRPVLKVKSLTEHVR